MRATDQCEAGLEQDARQPRLAIEAEGPANTKTRERTEGVATGAVQAMHGDSFSACRVDPGPMTNSNSFGMMAEPPALTCRDDVVVEGGDAAPKSCLPSLEMHSPTAAGGKDHLQRDTSSALRDRGDEGEKFKDFNFIRLVREQLLETACFSLLPEGYRDKTDAK